MTAPTFAERQPVYRKQWANMKIEAAAAVETAAKTLVSYRAVYKRVEVVTGVPWFFVACIHWREASGSFAGVLHNGEKIIGIGRKTSLVPAGRGPFATWDAAAADALTMRDLQSVKIDSVERFAYEAESYNGWGYFNHGVPSAYLWSHSSIYTGGKYIADGVWSALALDPQVGVMPLLLTMMGMDATIAFAPQPAAQPPKSAPASIPPPKPRPASVSAPAPQSTDWLVLLLKIVKTLFSRSKG